MAHFSACLERTFSITMTYSQQSYKESSSSCRVLDPFVTRLNTKLSATLQFISYLQLLYVAHNSIITSFVTFAPKSQPAPRGLIAHVSTSSGSDQTRSQKAPLWGISWLRSMVRIWSSVLMSGERPPCTQRICSSINWRKKGTCVTYSLFNPGQNTTSVTLKGH